MKPGVTETMSMTYEEFEWHVLRLVYEEGNTSLQPAYLAYTLSLPHEKIKRYLKHATDLGILELEVTKDGGIEYIVPGFSPDDRLPTPPWKREQQERARAAEQRAREAEERARRPDGADGDLGAPPTPGDDVDAQSSLDGADGSLSGRSDALPDSLRHYIGAQSGARLVEGPARAQPAQHAFVPDSAADAEGAMVRRDPQGDAVLRIEAPDDSFCDPSQTIFMRQIRVFGVESEATLRDHVQRLFEGFGYRLVQSTESRQRFERGSVTFILALVPLFVLVLPLFIYLFLYCMGRSTIQQEPVELDVQFRKSAGRDDCYEIDLTFIGLHGVVLGAADQRILNQEVDTLREELHWALQA